MGRHPVSKPNAQYPKNTVGTEVFFTLLDEIGETGVRGEASP